MAILDARNPSTRVLKNAANSMATTLGMFEPFKALDDGSRNNIASLFKFRNVIKGQYVISESQPSDEVYFLVSGVVHACAFSHNGKQVQFESLTSGMMFGELSAIDGKERSSNCIAATNVKLLVLSSVAFHRLIDEHKPVRDVVIARLAYLIRLHMRKFYELSTFSVAQRVRFEILRIASKVAFSADITADKSEDDQLGSKTITLSSVPTHQEIASRIGTHREAVTRELKSLESLGAITWRPGRYVIHDVTELTVAVTE